MKNNSELFQHIAENLQNSEYFVAMLYMQNKDRLDDYTIAQIDVLYENIRQCENMLQTIREKI